MRIAKYLLFFIWIIFVILFAEGISWIYLRLNPNFSFIYLQEYNKVIEKHKDLLNGNSAERGITIFFYGGSTMEGFPFNPTVTPVKWNELFFKKLYPRLKVNLINFGEGGKNSEYIYQALKKTIQYNPDVVVILFGHNEFLRKVSVSDKPIKDLLMRSSFFRLSEAGIKAMKEKYLLYKFKQDVFKDLKEHQENKQLPPAKEHKKKSEASEKKTKFFYDVDVKWVVADSPEMHLKLQKTKNNLNKIIQLCQEKSIPLLVATPPHNVKIFRYGNNFASKGKTLTLWEKYADQGASYFKKNKFQEALKEFLKAEQFDDTNAVLLSLMAYCYEILGDFVKASEYYNKANRYDIQRMTIFDDVEEIIRTVTHEKHIPYINIQTVFIKNSKNGLVDWEMIVDNAHPNLKGQYLLSKTLFKFIINHTHLFPEKNIETLHYDSLIKEFTLKKEFEYVSNRHLGDYYYNHFEESYAYYQKAYDAKPTKEICIRIIQLCRRFNRYDEAKHCLKELTNIKQRGDKLRIPE